MTTVFEGFPKFGGIGDDLRRARDALAQKGEE